MNNINTVNVENVTKLIDHYKALPGLHSWGYSDCAAGTLQNLGIIKDRMADYLVADALGITGDEAYSLISGPQCRVWDGLNDVQARDMVVATLQGLLDGNGVKWPVYAVPN